MMTWPEAALEARALDLASVIGAAAAALAGEAGPQATWFYPGRGHDIVRIEAGDKSAQQTLAVER